MAMLVLLSFENDERALSFVEAAQDGDVFTSVNDMPTEHAYPEVKALYKMPTQFHAAFDTHGARKTEAGWRLGPKWGWWICQVCRKPSELYWETIFKQSSFGKNLLSMFFTDDEEEKVAN